MSEATESGNMRHRILIQSQTESKDDSGGNIGKWFDQGYIWAELLPHKAWEIIQTEQLEMRIITRFMIRFNLRIKPQMRIVFRNRIYLIRGIIDKTGTNQWLEIITESLDEVFNPLLEPKATEGIL